MTKDSKNHDLERPIRVYVRVRGDNRRSCAEQTSRDSTYIDTNCIQCINQNHVRVMKNDDVTDAPKRVTSFSFECDGVFDQQQSQEDVFTKVVYDYGSYLGNIYYGGMVYYSFI